MIYEWIERNRKDIDILTSFLVTAIPVVIHDNFRNSQPLRK